jgi:hypothetical protein
MSHRTDALAAMRGEKPVHIPFIGRMNLWYNYHSTHGTLPERYQGWELWDIQRDLNIGLFGFGVWTASFFKKVHRGIEVKRTSRGNEHIVEYVTPYGTLRTRSEVTDLLKGTVDTAADTERIFKDEKDYDALQYLIEHTDIEENLDDYGKFINSMRGWHRSPFHRLRADARDTVEAHGSRAILL